MLATPLKRENIAEAVASAVRTMIVDGRLPEGRRVNEVRLAESLSVSRTPLREALSGLAREGALLGAAGHGYTVRPLTLQEFDQLYGIRPLLDPEALRLAGLPERARVEELEQMNRMFAAATDPGEAIALDDEWHRRLIDACPNRVLIELIEQFMLRTRRYEAALMRETKSVLRGTEDHAHILAALRDGNLPAACAALKANLMSGRAPIVEWLRNR